MQQYGQIAIGWGRHAAKDLQWVVLLGVVSPLECERRVKMVLQFWCSETEHGKSRKSRSSRCRQRENGPKRERLLLRG